MGNCIFLRKGETHTAPLSGILASDLAVGSSVYLMENGVAAEYLVVNQGIPSGSSLYDESCNGTWLLRKDIKENRQWNSLNVNDYENSTVHSYLNGDFYNLLGAVEKAAIKQVKIPYRAGASYSKTVTSGSSGLSAKIFLLSSTEVGFVHSYMPTSEGAKLAYFASCAENDNDSRRIATQGGAAKDWWLRSPYCNSEYGSQNALRSTNVGWWSGNNCTYSNGIRPALILPSNALFDKNTLILKGVK